MGAAPQNGLEMMVKLDKPHIFSAAIYIAKRDGTLNEEKVIAALEFAPEGRKPVFEHVVGEYIPKYKVNKMANTLQEFSATASVSTQTPKVNTHSYKQR